MGLQDRITIGKSSHRAQMALRRLASGIGSLGAGTIEILSKGLSLGQRNAIDFGDGFEITAAGAGVTADFPEHVTTAERFAMTPREGTIVYDTDQVRHFWFNGAVWAEV
jgi:hypothetical protein